MNKFIYSLSIKVWIACFFLLSALVSPQSHANLGAVEIPHPQNYDRVFAISDAHGMYPALLKILSAAELIDSNLNWIGKKDLLIVVGDSINKGSQSIEILDLWIRIQAQLSTQGGNLIHLLGNHEAEFLADSKHNKKFEALYRELNRKNLRIESLTDPNQPRGHYLRSMPLAAKVGAWIFCHSGFYPKLEWNEFKNKALSLLSVGQYDHPFIIGDESILEMKDWEKDKSTRKGLLARLDRIHARGVVFGHQPKAMKIADESGISRDGRLIKIDNGMAPDAGSNDGSILVFPNPKELTDENKTPETQTINARGQKGSLKKEKK